MSKKLLVVDDALIIREMIKDVARTAQWEIVGEATNGQEAIEAFRQLKPDAMTLDMVMPQYDGMHALRGIRQEYPQARVVVVSALDQRTVLRDAIKAGAADFLVKPFDPFLLIETLEKTLAAG